MNRLFICLCLVLMVGVMPARAALPPLELPLLYGDDGWKKLGDFFTNMKADDYFDVTYVFKSGTSYDAIRIKGSNILDLYRVMEAASRGDWAATRDQSVLSGINYFFPLFGQYMTLSDAVKTSITAVIANWSESLYQTKAYQHLVDELNRAVVTQAQNQEPYLPTMFLDSGTPAHARMTKVEDGIYEAWMRTYPDIELSQSSNPARIRQILGRDPLNQREIFDHFLSQAVSDQKDFILTTFRRVREDKLWEAKTKFYEKTVAALKKQRKLSFSIAVTRDTYKGQPLEGSVKNGDILAFESDLFIPFLTNGERAVLTWQVYRDDKTPVKGLRKELRLTQGDVTQNARLRFRLDSLPPGRYLTTLSRCIKQTCQENSAPFDVAAPLAVSRVFLSLDDKGSRQISRDPLSREANFLQADFTSGTDGLTAELTLTDDKNKRIARRQKQVQGFRGRISLPLDSSRLKEGTRYTARVLLTAPDGKQASKTLTFTPKFYSLNIAGANTATVGESRAFTVQAPSQMVPPFRLEPPANGREISNLSGNRFTFTPKADGNRTLAVVLVDSLGRRALGFKQVRVTPRLIEPLQPAPQLASRPVPQAQAVQRPPLQQSGSPASRQNLLALGRRKAAVMVGMIKQDIIAPCANTYFTDFVPNTVNGFSQSELLEIAGQSDAAIGRGGTYYTIVRDQLGRGLGRILNQFPADACGRQWVSQLMQNGYISRAQFNAYLSKQTNQQPRGNFYAVATMEKYLAEPDSCQVVEGRPRTGVFGKYTYTYQHGARETRYRRWIAAAGPGTREAAQNMCNDWMRRTKNLSGNYCPWIPTGSGNGNFQMEEREYIMPLR